MEQGPGPFQERCFGRNRNHGGGDHLLRQRLVDPGTHLVRSGREREKPRAEGRDLVIYLFIGPPTQRAQGGPWGANGYMHIAAQYR